MDLGVPNHRGLNELLCGKAVEITREKVDSVLVLAWFRVEIAAGLRKSA